MIDEQPVDPRAVVAEIKAEVKRRQLSGEWPPSLLSRINAPLHITDDEPPELLAGIVAARSIPSGGVRGSTIALSKRIIRRLIAWYVTPIVDDQTRFNVATVRELRRLQRRLERQAPAMHRSMHPSEASQRGEALSRSLCDIPHGPVLHLGDAVSLITEGNEVLLRQGDPIEVLETTAPASCGAVVLAGGLEAMSSTDVLALPSLLRKALRARGVAALEVNGGMAASLTTLGLAALLVSSGFTVETNTAGRDQWQVVVARLPTP